jgi:hypothetical protein
VVFSRKGAFLASVNLMLPLAGCSLLLMTTASRTYPPRKRGRWHGRGWTLLLVFAFGAALFVMLPKVEVTRVAVSLDD